MHTSQQPLTPLQDVYAKWATIPYKVHIDGAKQKIQILIIEQGTQLYDKLRYPLEKIGHTVQRSNGAVSICEQLGVQTPQLVLLSTALPQAQAFEMCVEIRQQSHVPLIVFTDSCHADVIVRFYELGADAVIPSPFIVKEVETRIMAVLRRSNKVYAQRRPAVLTIGKISLDDFSHVVCVDNQVVELTPTDYRLLRYFMQNVNLAMSKEAILEAIWDNELHDGSNLIEVAIRRLRQKIEKNPSNPQYLLTIHRVGYKFVQPTASH